MNFKLDQEILLSIHLLCVILLYTYTFNDMSEYFIRHIYDINMYRKRIHTTVTIFIKIMRLL